MTLELNVVGTQYAAGPNLTLYDPATILSTTHLNSDTDLRVVDPLLLPSTKRVTDTKSTITVEGSPLATSMKPIMKLEYDEDWMESVGLSEAEIIELGGAAQLREPEVLADVGYRTAEASPSLLSQTMRMQMLYTKDELEYAELETDLTITSVQFR